eukprot:SAG11_NODE_18444_length_491_cov_0.716837_1_plen_49_part_01
MEWHSLASPRNAVRFSADPLLPRTERILAAIDREIAQPSADAPAPALGD